MNDKIEWVLVPREPTEAMRRRGADRWIEANEEATTRKDEEESARCAWAAMLAAAPKPEAQAAGVAAPSIAAAEAMGAIGGPAAEPERLAFEAWMRGHCWALRATWDGSAYISDAEQGGGYCPDAARTRMLWAAWRDRAALSTPASHDAQQPAVVGDAIRSCRQWIEANRGTSLCAGGFESGMHYACIMIEGSLTPAATPGDKQGRDAAQVIRDALAYVNVRTDGDLLALADRAENWIRESRVLIDMQAKLIAAQKEGNGNG